VFFAIWWAWMNFTWFASAYDNDDVVYRLTVFVLMTGALILAAGVPRAFDDQDFGVITLGYVVMRLAMVGLWLRAAAEHPEGRRCALRYALGIAVLQVGWVLRLALPEREGLIAFFVLVALELSVPAWAEAKGRTTWHPRHIAERYGLFTIIVLGESILAGTVAIQTVLDEGGLDIELGGIIAGGLLLVFSMWWVYFDYQVPALLTSNRVAFRWGYGHLVIFAAIAAVGAGLAVAVDHAAGHGHVSDVRAGMIVAVPVAVYLHALWSLHFLVGEPGAVGSKYVAPVAAVLVLLAALTPQPVLLIGLIVAGMVAFKVARRVRLSERPAR
jgi:low temperature requirement protein LtrA